jgi:serine/threonine protein kinase
LRNVSVAPSSDGDNEEDLDRSLDKGKSYEDDKGGEVPSKGYYERFFLEERRLGMGAEGTVFLATHIIGGNVLGMSVQSNFGSKLMIGTYAVKKIAVGESKEYLVRMLREVRLLENLRHPNIIPYHHSWIEPTTFSA